MMYASLSAYMKNPKNSVTLYSRPPTKSPSLSVNRTVLPIKVNLKSLSMIPLSEAAGDGETNGGLASAVDVDDIHAAVLAAHCGVLPQNMHSLEDEIRRMDEKQNEGRGVSVLSVETGTDSLLVKLLNYLKDHRVNIVKIQKENLAAPGTGSRKGSIPSETSAVAGSSTDRDDDETARRRSDTDLEDFESAKSADDAKTPASSEKVFKKPAVKRAADDDEANNAKQTGEKSNAGAENKSTLLMARHQMSRYEVFVNLQEDGKRLNELLLQIENQVGGVRYRRRNSKQKKQFTAKTQEQNDEALVSPGFPIRINELDIISNHVLMYGAELDAEHPGFKDPEYRKRRLEFGQIAFNYQHGQPLPRVEYNDVEKQTWSTVFCELMRLYPDYACTEFLHNMQILQQECGYTEKDIPQLPDVSKFLKSRSGFQLRPVAGYLSPRDFLAGLAFRVFATTQYIRHPSEPFYSPEPDCCHELLGHVPMLADPEFAQFSQEIGLASIGASTEDIKKLAILYFFTMEFGLCRDVLQSRKGKAPTPQPPTSASPPETSDEEQAALRVYGAGLLSCVAELKHVLSGEANIRKFDTEEAIQTPLMVTTFQQTYFYNNSFSEAVEDVRRFAEGVKKPFTVRYNPYTEALEIIDNVRRVERLISELRQDATILSSALRRLGYEGALHYMKADKTVEILP